MTIGELIEQARGFTMTDTPTTAEGNEEVTVEMLREDEAYRVGYQRGYEKGRKDGEQAARVEAAAEWREALTTVTKYGDWRTDVGVFAGWDEVRRIDALLAKPADTAPTAEPAE